MSLCGGVSEWFSSYDYPLAPLQRETKFMKNKITEFVYNPAKETANILDRDGNQLFSITREEGLWLATMILKRFKFTIS
jgi:hypothetical protein